jgi:acyl-CoA dehydrogenase
MLIKKLLQWYKKKIPPISVTEHEALLAGTIGFEQYLFNGTPDWKVLLKQPKAQYSSEEQDFFNTELQGFCALLDDWEITHERMDLSEEAWEWIKTKGFLGLIIPKQYGGRAFSASALAFVLARLASISITAATTVGVANSLGPAELLLHYGTNEQKEYYLPRLASGEEIPCFALTNPDAGSDAASIPDRGIVCERECQGKPTLGILLNWNKRYITLCPIATVMGLAFHLLDPEHLLGDKEDIGVTCALIPANTPGIIKGHRHLPIGTAFFNGPTQGKDVFIPLDWIIGGQAMAGRGWQMLVECLSAGRAIALPAGAAGGAQMAALASGAYARIRRQFNCSIAEFEGIKAALAEIGGYTYIINAALSVTLATLDQGESPAVLSSILKYYTTELQRNVLMKAMDIHGGKTLCLGPKNYLARAFEASSISITVEGANILTRNFIIYGQGAIRCHPFIQEEMLAAEQNELPRFKRAVLGHIKLVCKHFAQMIWQKKPSEGLSSALLPYFKAMHYYSIRLAFMSDMMMLIFGAQLKKKERISARLADMLSTLYLLATVIKYYHDEGENAETRPFFEWSCQTLLAKTEEALWELWCNIPKKRGIGIFKRLFFRKERACLKPTDTLEHSIAELMTHDTVARSTLCAAVFVEPLDTNPLGQLEHAFKHIIATEPLERKLTEAFKKRQIVGFTQRERIASALEKNILTSQEADDLLVSEALRQEVIKVDDFAFFKNVV